MKHPKPWYWKQRNGWFCEPNGKRIFLGLHPEGAPTPQKSKKSGLWNAPQQILDAYHKLMGTKNPMLLHDEAVANVLDDFLTWCKENRAPRTEARYRDFIQNFINFGGIGRLGVSELSSAHVTEWLNARPNWNSTSKRNAITALQRGFNWSVKNLGLARNPIHGMEKPQAQRRTDVITPDEFAKAIEKATPAFRDLLVVSYDSGTRPFEVKSLEARHLQLDKHRAVIPASEAKGKRRPRAIYFPTNESMEIIRSLAKERPTGKLFLNSRGREWTGYAVKCAFARLDKLVGRRITHYMLRHTYITRKLVAGVDSHVVATLAGHNDTSMIDAVYSHIADDHRYMLEQSKRDINPESDSEAASNGPS